MARAPYVDGDTQRANIASGVRRAIELEMSNAIRSAAKPSLEERVQTRREQRFETYLRGRLFDAEDRERRDLGYSTTPGSYLIPTLHFDELVMALVNASAVLPRANVWRSTSGAKGQFPILSDVSNTASVYTENTAITEGSPTNFGRVVFDECKTVSADSLFRASYQLVQDSSIDLWGIVREVFAQRVARWFDSYSLTDATNGLVPNTTNTVTSASPTSISYADLVNVNFAIDAAYRGSPNAAWVMNDATLKAITGLVDSNGRPILALPNQMQTTEVDTNNGTRKVPYLFGNPVISAPSMPTIAASARTIVLADLSRAGVARVVNDASITILRERFADAGELSAVGYARADWRSSGFAAAVLVQHA